MIDRMGDGKFIKKARQSWKNLKERCHNPKHEAYKNYGGRGIEVRFRDFLDFYAEVGDPPSSQHTIDRFPDNNGHYQHGNVRWALPKEQHRNSRQNRFVTCNGKTQIVEDWAIQTGLPRTTIFSRLAAGDDGERLFRPSDFSVSLELLGTKNGRLTIIEYAGKLGNKRKRPNWLCRCECGVEKIIAERHLNEGPTGTKSCGCLSKEKAAELAKTLVLKRWAKIKGNNEWQTTHKT